MIVTQGSSKTLKPVSTIVPDRLAFLKTEGYEPERVVVERNLDIVPRDELEKVVLEDEDVVEVLRFVGGG